MIILSGLDLTDVSFSLVLQSVAIFIVIYAAYKKIKEFLNDINADHERKKKWDVTADIVRQKEKVWDDAVADVEGEREFIVKRYDSRLDDLENRMEENQKNIEKGMEENKIESDAKLQELKADVIILAESIRAVLEGQIAQGLNGPVKEAKEKLDHYLISSLGR